MLTYIQVYTLVKIILFVKYFEENILSSFMIYVNLFCLRAEREGVGTSCILVTVEYDKDKDNRDIIYFMYFSFSSYRM